MKNCNSVVVVCVFLFMYNMGFHTFNSGDQFCYHLKLEALECLSSCRNAFGAQNQGTVLENGDVELLNQVLELSPVGDSSNWTFFDLAKQKELLAKSDLAMQYLSQLLKEHPSWGDIMVPFGGCNYMESAYEEYKRSVENFYGKLTVTLEYFQQKFSLNPFHLIDKVSSCR